MPGSRPPGAEPPPPGAVAAGRAQPERRLRGRPGRPRPVTDRELFGTVRVRRPKALRRVVPRDILERLDARRPRRPHRPRRSPATSRCSGAAAPARSATTWSSSFAGGGPDLRPGRADRPRQPLRRRRSARSSRAWAAASGAGPRPGSARPSRTSPRSCSSLYAARAAAEGHAFAPDTPWQQEMEASFPYEETPDQLRAVDRGQGGHGGRPADGPARRGRRGLRQDRGRAAGRVQGDPGRQAGRGPRPDDRARRAALQDVRPSASRRSRSRSGCCRGPCRPREQEATLAGLAAGSRGHRRRDAPAALEGRPLPGPRPPRRRRGAALRRGRQGAPQAAAHARSTS